MITRSRTDIMKFLFPEGIPVDMYERIDSIQAAIGTLINTVEGSGQRKCFVRRNGPESEKLNQQIAEAKTLHPDWSFAKLGEEFGLTRDAVKNRYYEWKDKQRIEQVKEVQEAELVKASNSEAQPAQVPSIPEEAQKPQDGAEDKGETPAPQAISRQALEGKIYDMYTIEHLSPDEISEKLYAQGLYYSKKTVEVRLKKLGVI